MRKLKTLLILLLTLGLAALLSTAALADDATNGTCGTNLTWTLNTDTGVLTISGEGAMEDYECGGAPWYSQREIITSVVIEDGVTSIGENAFCGSSLASVTIPDGVIFIGEGAFASCFNLEEVVLPSSITYIGNYVFELCDNLTDIVIPDNVTFLGDGVFSWCTALVSISIGSGITEIGEETFNKCLELKDVEIPAGVTSIGYGAFAYCLSLTNITLPEGVTSIGDYAFSSCNSLSSISIPVSVTHIGDYAFAEFGNALTDVYYSGDETDWAAIDIGDGSEFITSATIHYNSTGPDDETGDSTPGDLNGDGEVDASDLTVLARHVGKVETMEDETALANADVTGDGNVDASDLTRLAQYVGKIISALD
ncbi:MAG: leucine-rich repeat protein [Oscillospiraceae bacterium]|nr:leucine-rich repeat protein [Oscillospiraceae bacterium]MCD8240439.1 leucine-rich repeat protein [Oscillospiraceae bacterium]